MSTANQSSPYYEVCRKACVHKYKKDVDRAACVTGCIARKEKKMTVDYSSCKTDSGIPLTGAALATCHRQLRDAAKAKAKAERDAVLAAKTAAKTGTALTAQEKADLLNGNREVNSEIGTLKDALLGLLNQNVGGAANLGATAPPPADAGKAGTGAPGTKVGDSSGLVTVVIVVVIVWLASKFL